MRTNVPISPSLSLSHNIIHTSSNPQKKKKKKKKKNPAYLQVVSGLHRLHLQLPGFHVLVKQCVDMHGSSPVELNLALRLCACERERRRVCGVVIVEIVACKGEREREREWIFWGS